jgi:hypothetical protein
MSTKSWFPLTVERYGRFVVVGCPKLFPLPSDTPVTDRTFPESSHAMKMSLDPDERFAVGVNANEKLFVPLNFACDWRTGSVMPSAPWSSSAYPDSSGVRPVSR